MPPSLAVLIFVGLILWCLRCYATDGGKISFGSFIAFLWLGNNLTRPIGYWFADGTSAAGADPASGSFIDRNFYLILMFLASVTLMRRNVDWPVTLRALWPLLLFQAYLLVSCTWSVLPFVAFKRWFKDCGEILILLLLLTDRRPGQAFQGVFLRCAIVFIPLSVLFMKYYPEIGRYNHRWTWTWGYCGVTLSKNALGLLAMISGLFLLWWLVDSVKVRGWKGWVKRWPELVILLMCVWILSVAESATALACFWVGAVVFLAVRFQSVRLNMKLVYAMIMMVAAIMIAFTVSHDFRGVMAELLGRNVTLTDRTVIWEESLKLGTNPILGAGFFSAWLMPSAADFVEEFRLSHSHNGYLETYLHSGLIGLLFLGIILWKAVDSAAVHLTRGSAFGPLFMAIIVGALLYNYTEVSFNRSNGLGFLVWAIAVSKTFFQIPTPKSEQWVAEFNGSADNQDPPSSLEPRLA